MKEEEHGCCCGFKEYISKWLLIEFFFSCSSCGRELAERTSVIVNNRFSYCFISIIQSNGTILTVLLLKDSISCILVQEKSKKEKHEKLGEKEETIPPDYRLTEVKVIELIFLVCFTFLLLKM